jgi:hypothetical protein
VNLENDSHSCDLRLNLWPCLRRQFQFSDSQMDNIFTECLFAMGDSLRSSLSDEVQRCKYIHTDLQYYGLEIIELQYLHPHESLKLRECGESY